MAPGDEALCWRGVWRLLRIVDTLEVDKLLLSSLRELRSLLSGDILDAGCLHVKSAFSENISSLLSGNGTGSGSSTGSGSVPATPGGAVSSNTSSVEAAFSSSVTVRINSCRRLLEGTR